MSVVNTVTDLGATIKYLAIEISEPDFLPTIEAVKNYNDEASGTILFIVNRDGIRIYEEAGGQKDTVTIANELWRRILKTSHKPTYGCLVIGVDGLSHVGMVITTISHHDIGIRDDFVDKLSIYANDEGVIDLAYAILTR